MSIVNDFEQVYAPYELWKKLNISTETRENFAYFLNKNSEVIITAKTNAAEKGYKYLSRYNSVLYVEENDPPCILVYDNIYKALGIKRADSIYFSLSEDEKEILVHARKVNESKTNTTILESTLKKGDPIRVQFTYNINVKYVSKSFCGTIEEIDDEYIKVKENDLGRDFILISRNAGVIISSI